MAVDLSKLTSRQKQIYEFLRDAIQSRGYGPSVREIGQRFGILSPNGVVCHLKALEKKGLVRRDRKSARAITLLQESVQRPLQLAIMGRVAAGAVQEAIEADFGSIDFRSLAEDSARFAVRVQDESLADRHIRRGDHLVFDRTRSSRTDALVAARRSDGAIALYERRSHRDEPDRLERLGEGPDVSGEPLTIVGELVAVVRTL